MSGEDQGRRRTNLGRGLDALFGEEGDGYGPLDRLRQTRTVPIEHLVPNPHQPRRRFDEEALQNLVDSVREQGVLQPILVRPIAGDDSRYEIIAGERRWRAAQKAQLHDVPVIVRELSDLEALQIAIVENVQRSDLTPLEEAEGYRRLIQEFSYTQDDLAKAVGKSRSHIANTLRLLDLPERVRGLLHEGQLTAGHARALLACPDPDAAAREVVSRGLNVRQTEALARDGAAPKSRSGSGGARSSASPVPRRALEAGEAEKHADIVALEQEMSNLLGLRVSIQTEDGGSQAGSLSIHYRTLEQLDDVLHRLSHGSRGAPG